MAAPTFLDRRPPARPAVDPLRALDELAAMAQRAYNQVRYGGATTGVQALRHIEERARDHARHIREDRETIR
jgi:hypothetical protein